MTSTTVFSRRRVTFGAAALLAAGATLTACGGSTLDAEKLNETIVSQVNATDPNVTVTVDCPSGIKPEAGGTFDCPATVDGQPLTLTVTQEDDQGNVKYVADSSILSVAEVQSKITTQLTEQVPGTWQITCPTTGTTYIVATPNTVFDCTVAGTSPEGVEQTGTVAVTVTDTDSNITWALK